MLKVTDRAAAILKVAKSIEGSPEAGVRIKRGPTSNNKSIGVGFSNSDGPEEGDLELERNGLRIFVEDALVGPLQDRTLDVRNAEEGPLLVFH